ncbi:MAG: hypothetical protein UT33_C0011G0151 [Candidatus Peregrinibacteria bacterium GW2011_GWC2_39_14]|nr:MAG: hypothetical protein UT33_C0011G0151 [Candidatus Peregrinibacteria bacterium GW2011_GWC2_39_14]
MMKKSKLLITVFITVFVVGIGGFGLYRITKSASYIKEKVPEAINIDAIAANQPTEKTAQASNPTPTIPAATPVVPATPPSPPTELNLAMKFYTQAPFGDWREPWQNSCEEASMLLIANTYFKHNWTREQFRDQILAIVAYENKMYGDYKENDINQIVKTLKEFLKLKGVIHKDPSFKDVQNILAKGHFIIVPLAGKELKNPFYTNGGPDYHVMVIKGYKANEKIITEDVGTRSGENYVYSWKTIINAMHDYTIPIDNGAKILIEVIPPS